MRKISEQAIRIEYQGITYASIGHLYRAVADKIKCMKNTLHLALRRNDYDAEKAINELIAKAHKKKPTFLGLGRPEFLSVTEQNKKIESIVKKEPKQEYEGNYLQEYLKTLEC